ncbi:MAG: hypothetical protein AB1521_09130 [Bacteroidota bacterium]
MKKISYCVFILLLLATSNYFAQTDKQINIYNALKEIIQLSKDKQYEKASLRIAYNGKDTNRNLKTPFDPAKSDELGEVKRICKKISALTDLSTNYKIGKVISKKDGNTEFYLVSVSFISGTQELRTNFELIETADGFLLTTMK